jgi:hypothetical protein
MWAYKNGESGTENGLILNLLKNSEAIRNYLFGIFMDNKKAIGWKVRIPKKFVQEWIHP